MKEAKRAEERDVVGKINLLFICKFNRFRSKVAEAYFRKINKNKRIRIKSAGLIRGYHNLDSSQVRIARQFGIEMKGQPMGMTSKLLKWQNIIVIVANDVPYSLFKKNKDYGKRTICWKIPDASSDNPREIKKSIRMIMKKVDGLVRELR